MKINTSIFVCISIYIINYYPFIIGGRCLVSAAVINADIKSNVDFINLTLYNNTIYKNIFTVFRFSLVCRWLKLTVILTYMLPCFQIFFIIK